MQRVIRAGVSHEDASARAAVQRQGGTLLDVMPDQAGGVLAEEADPAVAVPHVERRGLVRRLHQPREHRPDVLGEVEGLPVQHAQAQRRRSQPEAVARVAVQVAEAIKGHGEPKDRAGIQPRAGREVGEREGRGAVPEGVEDAKRALDGIHAPGRTHGSRARAGAAAPPRSFRLTAGLRRHQDFSWIDRISFR